MYSQCEERAYDLKPGGTLTVRTVYVTDLRRSYQVMRVLADFRGSIYHAYSILPVLHYCVILCKPTRQYYLVVNVLYGR